MITFALIALLSTPQAKKAVEALAEVNHTVSEAITVFPSKDGKTFQVEAFEVGIGLDNYVVETGGGHDCLVLSVKADGKVTVRP